MKGRWTREPEHRAKICKGMRSYWQREREWAAQYYGWQEVQSETNPCFRFPQHLLVEAVENPPTGVLTRITHVEPTSDL